jgi:hypothetical protein
MIRRLRAPIAIAVAAALALTACGGGDPEPTPSVSPSAATQPSASPSEEPSPIGTEALAQWATVWRAAFQEFANDLSAAVIAIRNRDTDALREALARMPADAREAIRKIDDAGAVPAGFEDEVRRLRGLVEQAGSLAPKIAEDCIGDVGLACAADVTTLLSVVAQILDTLRPLGLGPEIKIEI